MGTPSATGRDGLLPPGVLPLTADDPAKIGGHTLLGRLGTGGMGVVYLGRDPLGGLVAVKSAYGETTAETTRRFAAEVACLRRVPAACTTRLIADGTGHARPYIVTEYVEGRSLEHVVGTGGPLQPEQVRALATGVGRALAAIHEAGLVHRDLKPANVILTLAGPRVIDFGIAQRVGAAGGPTGPGQVVGSPGWIPPERLNRHPATPASDLFGWGCLVAYAGTGRHPFGSGDAEELTRRTLHEPPDLDGIADPLRGLVAGALAKDPAERPSAAEVLARLAPGSEGTARYPAAPVALAAGTDSGTRVIPVTALRRRRWQAVAGAAVTAVALLIAVIVTTAADHGSPRTPPSGTPSASPSGDVAATQRAPVARPRVTRHPSSRAPAGHGGGHKGKGGGGGGGKGDGKGKGGGHGKG